MSETIKLRSVYKSEAILDLLKNSEVELTFYEDQHLVTNYSFIWKYKDYTTLKTKLTIDIFTQLQNISEIQKALLVAIEDWERVGVN